MLSCILIDDEPHVLKALQEYLAYLPAIQVVGSYTDPTEALRTLQTIDPVDLIILDVNMPKLNGVELAGLIRNKTRKLVFSTGHAKYAYEAFEVQADAYLLKPYSLSKFVETIQKLGLQEEKPVPASFFFVKSKEDDLKLVRINFADITAVESMLNYVKIYTQGKQVTTYMSLGEMARILAAWPGFLQVHRSFIIQTGQIKSVNGNTIELNDGLRTNVGEMFRSRFNEFLSGKTIKAGMFSQP